MKALYWKFESLAAHIADLPLLLIRLILAYGFWGPAKMKWADINGIAQWFEYINIPLPRLNAYLATSTEMAGVFLLLFGLGTRLISIPLIIVMVVAILTVHMGKGWLAIASSQDPEVANRLGKAKDILKENGNYEWAY
jgi:putative oxidoreductase